MKKTFRFFGIMLSIMLMAVSFSACSGDDDDDKNPSVVGTWIAEEQFDVGTIDECTSFTEMTLKKDGTMTLYQKITYKYSGEIESYVEKGRYEVINDMIIVWWDGYDDEPSTIRFTINGKKMTAYNEDGDVMIFTRK